MKLRQAIVTALVWPVLLGFGACAPAPGATPLATRATDAPTVVQIVLPMSNAYLIKAQRPVLIDSGGPEDAEKIVEALTRAGVAPRDLGLILLTHGHADHAGAARRLHALTGAPIALGAEDEAMTAVGRNGKLDPVGIEAWMIRPFVSPPFPPFRPDIRVEKQLDLAPWGVAGRAIALPGHTPGSLAILLDDHSAFVGDLMRGGSMGGRLNPHAPHDHYFQPDLARAHRDICALLDRGVETFYVGHGGPLDRAAVQKVFPCDRGARGP